MMNTGTFSRAIKAIFLNDIRRFGKASLISIVLLLAAVFFAARNILQSGGDNNSLYVVLFIASLIYPVASALTIWRYLFSKRELTFMHSIPANRMTLFISHTLSGLIFAFVPLILGIICAKVTIPSTEALELISMLITPAAVTFSFCTLAAMLAGTSVMQLLLTLGLGAILPLTNIFISGFGTYFLAGFESLITMNSFTYMIYPTDGNSCIRDIVLSAIVLCLAYYLYSKRPLENAGSSCIFPGISPLETGIISICLAAIASAYSFGTLSQPPIQICIAMLIFILISLAVYGRKNLFRGKSLKAIGIFACILFVITASFAADICGFEKKLPAADKIESVDLDFGESFEYASGSFTVASNVKGITSEDAIECILALNKEIAALAEPSRKYFEDGSQNYIRYHMKSGATLVRKYYDADIEKLENDKIFKNLYETEDFKKGLLLNKNKLFTDDANIDDIELTITSAISGNCKKIPSEYSRKLIKAIDADTLEKSYEEQTSGEFIGVLELDYNGSLQDGWYITIGDRKEHYDQWINIPVRASDTHVIEFLKSIDCYNLIDYSDCELTKVEVTRCLNDDSYMEATISSDELGMHTMDEYIKTYGLDHEHIGMYSVVFHVIDINTGKKYEIDTSIRKKDAPAYFDKLKWEESE